MTLHPVWRSDGVEHVRVVSEGEVRCMQLCLTLGHISDQARGNTTPPASFPSLPRVLLPWVMPRSRSTSRPAKERVRMEEDKPKEVKRGNSPEGSSPEGNRSRTPSIPPAYVSEDSDDVG